MAQTEHAKTTPVSMAHDRFLVRSRSETRGLESDPAAANDCGVVLRVLHSLSCRIDMFALL